MTRDGQGSLDERERYWELRAQYETAQRHLDSLLDQARQAIERDQTAEARDLLLNAQRLQQQVPQLADTLGLAPSPRSIAQLVRECGSDARGAALGEQSIEAINTRFAQLAKLADEFTSPEVGADVRRMHLATLQQRAEHLLQQRDIYASQAVNDALLRLAPLDHQALAFDGRLLLERIGIAREQGQLDTIAPMLNQLRRAIQRAQEANVDTRVVDELSAALREEQIAAYAALAARARDAKQYQRAQEYYRQILNDAPDGSVAAVDAHVQRAELNQRLRWRRRVLIAVGMFIVLGGSLLFARAIRLPEPVCAANGLGALICPPTPTPTITPAPTTTPVPTTTPTATATPSPTPSVTPIPPPTPTLVPLLGRLRNDRVAVYADPVRSDQIVAELGIGSEWHLCARAGRRYQIAQTFCNQTQPLGWVTETNIAPLFEGQFPRALVTPLPSIQPTGAGT